MFIKIFYFFFENHTAHTYKYTSKIKYTYKYINININENRLLYSILHVWYDFTGNFDSDYTSIYSHEYFKTLFAWIMFSNSIRLNGFNDDDVTAGISLFSKCSRKMRIFNFDIY